MSHEYTIYLKEPSADSILTALRNSAMFAYERPDHIAFKDPHSGNSWIHDVRVFKKNECELFLEITVGTNALYLAFKDVLAKKNYELTEHEDDEIISLERAFVNSMETLSGM